MPRHVTLHHLTPSHPLRRLDIDQDGKLSLADIDAALRPPQTAARTKEGRVDRSRTAAREVKASDCRFVASAWFDEHPASPPPSKEQQVLQSGRGIIAAAKGASRPAAAHAGSPRLSGGKAR